MSGSLQICNLSDDLLSQLKSFRFRKTAATSSLILRIDRDAQELLIEEDLQDCSVEDIRDSLPDTQPRYVLVSYKVDHSDGRVSYPYCLVFLTPQGCNPEIQMLYAGTKNKLVKESGVTKDFEIREVDELTDEFLLEKLNIRK